MTLRVMTYNIRACLGTDRVRSVERIAGVIAREDPDIAALQEVDFERPRSAGLDQAAEIADACAMRCVPGASFEEPDGGRYGNAVLTRGDATLVRHAALPTIEGTEQRSAMWVRVEAALGPIDLVNTHLSFRLRDRRWQAGTLLGEEWFGHPQMGEQALLCGDLNCAESGAGCRALRRRLNDAPARLRRGKPARTWPTRFPMRRIDFILTTPALEITDLRVVRTDESRVASDHFPVVASIRLSQESPPTAEETTPCA